MKWWKWIWRIAIGFFTVTYLIFQFNLDMKLIEVLYKLLHKYHDYKEKDRDVAF